DPDSPKERIDFMLGDSGAIFCISDDSRKEKNNYQLSIINYQLSIINYQLLIKTSAPSAPSAVKPESASPAYVIYTSGSTGRPKGVLVQHDSAVNLITSQLRHLPMDHTERVLQYSNIYFDASVEQIFTAFAGGGVLVLVGKDVLMEGKRFDLFLVDNCITHLNAAPSFLTHLELNFPGSYSLRRIITGGDICPVPLARRLSRYCAFYNEYGPTETTVMMLRMRVEELPENLSHVPVGKPISNTAAYILDQWYNPVPIGLTGELYIGGDCMTRGYLNRPELTANKFDQDFKDWKDDQDLKKEKKETSAPSAVKLYRTGDLARWLEDGNIELLGRMDFQVKVRGYRVELGEVESRLLGHETIKDAVVVAAEGNDEETYLCAYVVSNRKLDIPGLRDELSLVLPDYMVPVYIMPLDEIPLTGSGKVDKGRLPQPELQFIETEYSAPVDSLEETLVSVWADVLKVEKNKIGTGSNFFKLGG
ncbi:MAG: amino acid adenylation domain-containing protein, partial [bacterium]|nr:amino acid adenylation domain-containing protein [bacterium]